MAHQDLDTWLVQQEKKASSLCTTMPGPPRPHFLQQEPPLLAALRGAYFEQENSSDCSLTSVTILVNALTKKDPPYSSANIIALADEADRKSWEEATRPQGTGVKFAELVRYATGVFGRVGFKVSPEQPERSEAAENAFRNHLLALSPSSALILYVDQGVFTGERNVPHVTLVGAYDATDGRVLILEVDGTLPSLYLSPLTAVMEAMQRTVDNETDALFGQRGGWLRIERK